MFAASCAVRVLEGSSITVKFIPFADNASCIIWALLLNLLIGSILNLILLVLMQKLTHPHMSVQPLDQNSAGRKSSSKSSKKTLIFNKYLLTYDKCHAMIPESCGLCLQVILLDVKG